MPKAETSSRSSWLILQTPHPKLQVAPPPVGSCFVLEVELAVRIYIHKVTNCAVGTNSAAREAAGGRSFHRQPWWLGKDGSSHDEMMRSHDMERIKPLCFSDQGLTSNMLLPY